MTTPWSHGFDGWWCHNRHPRKTRVIVKEPVMLDVIWLLGVIALFILLALCVKGVDAL